jgi:hypothetical protein
VGIGPTLFGYLVQCGIVPVLKPFPRKKSRHRHHGFEQNLKIKKVIALDGVKMFTKFQID